jgi:CRISPR-associated exonuclease Cas4
MSLLILLLAVAIVTYLVLGRLQSGRRASLGLANAAVLAADDSAIRSPTLRSDRLGLIGRPDHLVRIDGHLIPVEQKPRARRVHDSHVMQLAAQCLLVSEVYGVRPPFGLLVLAGGVCAQVPFTPALERRLLETIADMRELLASNAEPGPRWVARKCQPCGFFSTCWEYPVRR